MAMAIDDVRMTLGVDRFSLIGSSYGGFLSLLYAIRRPDLVTSLILVDTSASYDFRHESLQTAKRQGRAETLDALHRLWDGSLESDRAFQADWQEILPLYFHQLTRQKIQRIADNISYRLETRKQILPTLQGYNVRDQLGSINLPCLVIVGRHDWITSAAQAEELASGLPNGELIVFEESGHYPFIEENDAFLHRVRDWLLMHGA
jgi:proline iminopeptidase